MSTFSLVNTNVERNTKDLVAKVRAKFEKYPRIVEPVLESIHCVSQQFLAALGNNGNLDVAQMEDLIDLNQGLLETLGVSHLSLRRIISIFAQYGELSQSINYRELDTQPLLSSGLHGKLTGAGGGGFAFALVPSSMGESAVEKVRDSLESGGFTVLRTKVGGRGVEVTLDAVQET